MSEIRLTIPGEREYFGVAHLVLGGLASRHSLTIESFEDLLLALDGLLDRTRGEPAVTLSVHVDGGEIRADVGPFAAGSMRNELERESGDGIGLRRLLDTVVDGFSVAHREGGDWVQLTKAARSANAG
ncbi:MAG: hypothetical protein ACJ75P_06760 [Gaiellaceae bacterium]